MKFNSSRSQLSKLVDAGESGKIFSVVGIGQSVMALVSHSTFGAVYRLSLGWMLYPDTMTTPIPTHRYTQLE